MSYALPDIWNSFLSSLQEPFAWAVIGSALLACWLLAHLMAKPQITSGKEPVAAAKGALVAAAFVAAAAAGGTLWAASRWVPGSILLLVIVLVLPGVLALALGRPLEVES